MKENKLRGNIAQDISSLSLALWAKVLKKLIANFCYYFSK